MALSDKGPDIPQVHTCILRNSKEEGWLNKKHTLGQDLFPIFSYFIDLIATFYETLLPMVHGIITHKKICFITQRKSQISPPYPKFTVQKCTEKNVKSQLSPEVNQFIKFQMVKITTRRHNMGKEESIQ